MICATLGFRRDDGDFQCIATLNNNDGLIPPAAFDLIAKQLAEAIQHHSEGESVEILERQDAPDYINLDEG